MKLLSLIGRTEPLFENDVNSNGSLLREKIESSKFLVLGGAVDRSSGYQRNI